MNKEEQKPRAKDMIIYCSKCNSRIILELNQREAWCRECGSGWVIRWLYPDLPFAERRIITTS